MSSGRKTQWERPGARSRQEKLHTPPETHRLDVAAAPCSSISLQNLPNPSQLSPPHREWFSSLRNAGKVRHVVCYSGSSKCAEVQNAGFGVHRHTYQNSVGADNGLWHTMMRWAVATTVDGSIGVSLNARPPSGPLVAAPLSGDVKKTHNSSKAVCNRLALRVVLVPWQPGKCPSHWLRWFTEPGNGVHGQILRVLKQVYFKQVPGVTSAQSWECANSDKLTPMQRWLAL